ncbi:hypothetical protein AB0L75_19655 [Streptomyces sp. NPDC052101]|uniref:hypothetical protein n=1 Tax=Streptomyces sp. NPDC052101 TaxID=3155763 RepID=UPI00343B64B1
MPITHSPHQRRSGSRATVAWIGAALLVVLCCAGPTLVAAGALAGLGAWLSSPWLIAAAAVLLATAVITAIHRHRGNTSCRPPAGGRADEERPHGPGQRHRPN